MAGPDLHLGGAHEQVEDDGPDQREHHAACRWSSEVNHEAAFSISGYLNWTRTPHLQTTPHEQGCS